MQKENIHNQTKQFPINYSENCVEDTELLNLFLVLHFKQVMRVPFACQMV